MGTVSIGSDTVADVQGLENSYKSNTSSSSFDQVLSGLSYAAGISGETVAESFYAAGKDNLATIAAVSSNAVYQSGSNAASLATSSATGYGSTGTSGLYATGGYSPLYSTSGSDTTSSMSDLEGLIAESGTTQAYMMGIQIKVGTDTMMFQAQSNLEKNRTDALKSAAANLK